MRNRFILTLVAVGLSVVASLQEAHAASFFTNAYVQVVDTNGALTVSASSKLTVSCWFKMSVPSGQSIASNMTIVVNRKDGDENSLYAYLLRYNVTNGCIEFVAKGSSGSYSRSLIQNPYLDRWYHVAMVQNGSQFYPYIDGRSLPYETATIGNSAVSNGVSIGGWSTNKFFMGEIQEVAIYQQALSSGLILSYMYRDQAAATGLKGYYKLGATTNSADLFRNMAASAPPGTDGSKAGTGSIVFEEVDQGGEQSLYDAKKNGGQDAVIPLSGGFVWQQTPLARPTPGIAFQFQYGYSSANAYSGGAIGPFDPFSDPPLARGWRHSFESMVVPDSSVNDRSIVLWSGNVETWTNTSPGAFTYGIQHKEYRGEFRRLSDGSEDYEWTTPARLVYRFRSITLDGSSPDFNIRGRLLEIRDFNPATNKVTVCYRRDPDGYADGTISQVVDSVGGAYVFKYDVARLTNVTFNGWGVDFAYNASNRLAGVSRTAPPAYSNVNTRWSFNYSASGLLTNIVDPRSNAVISVFYDKYGRRTNEVDSLGRARLTEYGVPDKRQIRHTDPDGYKWVETFDRKGHLLSQQDPFGNTTTYAYNDAGNVISRTDPRGYLSTYAYDARANKIAETNAFGLVTRWTYHPFFNKATEEVNPLNWSTYYQYDAAGNLVSNWDGLSSLISYTYTSNGLVSSARDANGNLSSFSYSPDGFLLARTDQAGSVWRYGRNDLGWQTAVTNPLNEVVTSDFDINGNSIRTVDALARVTTAAFDPNGNVVAQSDRKGQMTYFFYDSGNQRTQVVDRIGATNKVSYTRRGEIEAVRDALGNITSNSYDSANRLVKVTDPLGNAVSYEYDVNNNRTAVIDKLGRRWIQVFDRLNRVVSKTDPLGNTTQWVFDEAGRIKTIITPNSYPSLHVYDGRGRLNTWVDAEGYRWAYEYDHSGNITNITDALGGHYVMAYGSRNERILERNQDDFEWHYLYDELLRPRQQTDPNGTTRALLYDAGGRLETVEFSTGRKNTFLYDDNDNPEVGTRTGSGPTTSTRVWYDSKDRVIQCRDCFSKNIFFTYDALGRRSTLKYPDGKTLTYSYDALNRLTNQLDWAGRSCSYYYDLEGRLVARKYPNGVVQTNTFDTAGRLTDLAYLKSSNNTMIALSYAYDRNGNKTSFSEKGTLDWIAPTAIDETARYTPSGRLIDRVDAAVTNRAFVYHYDASGKMTNCVGAGQSFDFTYDEDNRVLSLDWDWGVSSKAFANRYDAVGRRVSKTTDGVETRYVLDLALGMEKILCDLNAANQITAWYVHGPDLCYSVDQTNGFVCYHGDAQGNVIALSDGATNTIAQYAYTPYGRSLGSSSQTNNAAIGLANPYRFVGSQGVMATEELPNLYFMRARYYSAEAGVFLSTDPVKHIGPGWKPVAYPYALGNPVRLNDPKGEYTGWDDAAALGLGAVWGIMNQVISDVTAGEMSGWEDYAGSAVGGAVDWEMKLYGVGFTGAGGLAGGAAKSTTKQLLKNLTGKQQGIDVQEFAEDMTIGYASSVTLIPSGVLSGAKRESEKNSAKGSDSDKTKAQERAPYSNTYCEFMNLLQPTPLPWSTKSKDLDVCVNPPVVKCESDPKSGDNNKGSDTKNSGGSNGGNGGGGGNTFPGLNSSPSFFSGNNSTKITPAPKPSPPPKDTGLPHNVLFIIVPVLVVALARKLRGASALLMLLACMSAQADVTNGLVAWYKCDGNAADSSGYGRDGTLCNNPSFTNGVLDQGLYLVGQGHTGSSGQYVSIPYVNLVTQSQYSISVWAKIDGNSSSLNHSEYIVYYGDIGIQCNTNQVDFSNGAVGCTYVLSTNDSFHWRRYTLVCSQSVMTAYVNASVVGVATGASANSKASAGLAIHWWSSSVSTRYIGGVDDVRVYNRALTPSEVSSLSKVPIAGNVAYAGGQIGPIRVLATTNSADWGAVDAATISAPGAFIVEAPWGTGNVWIKAYRDSNEDNLKGSSEACGEYVGNPVATTGQTSNVNVVLTDPDVDSDVDGLPDWWELKYFTNTTVAVTNQDADADDLDNIHEYLAGTNPRSSDTDGDGLPDGWEVRYCLDPAGYRREMNVVITGYSRSEALSDFPCLVVVGTNIPNFNYSAFLSPLGTDLRVFAANGTELSYEIEKWNPSGLSYIWVRVPVFTNNTSLVLQWGDVGFTNSPAYTTNGAAWDAKHKGVWHFGELGGGSSDSTFNRNIGSPQGSVTYGANGIIGRCISLDGTSSYISVGESSNSLSLTSRLTISAWGYYDDSTYAYRGFVGKAPLAFNTSQTDYDLNLSSDGQLRVFLAGAQYFSGTQNIIPQRQWFQAAATYDASSLKIYINGRLCTNINVSGAISDNCNLQIGKNWDVPWKGMIDEVRIADQAVSSNWVWASWANVVSNNVFCNYSVPGGITTVDSDHDGLNDYQEFLLSLNPTNADTDGGGIRDGWEVQYGMNPTNATDDIAIISGDQMTYLQKYQFGLNPMTNDTDGDGLTDYQELFVSGTSATNPSTAGDGISDGWKAAHGLNPGGDYSSVVTLDGLTMYQKYTNNLDPWVEQSLGDGLSDYERLYGKKTATCYYDKIDRLVGIDYNHGPAGLAIAYDYDGNGNIIHQKYLSRDANTNGIPDLWEYLNGLVLTNTIRITDSDRDGWTDYQEWLYGSEPVDSSSVPGQGVAGLNVGSFSFPFAVSNFVMATGDLNGDGVDEVVLSADGNPGTKTNSIYILSQGFSGWTTAKVDVVGVGVTSLAVANLTNTANTAVYYGTRNNGGTGSVMNVSAASNVWTQSSVSISNDAPATYVWGDINGVLWVTVGVSNRSQVVKLSRTPTNWVSTAVDAAVPYAAGISAKSISSSFAALSVSNGVRFYDSSLMDWSGLRHYYSFSEATGTTIADSCSNANGSVAGGVSLGITGVAGNAVSFNGSSSVITFPSIPNMADGQDWSIALWTRDGANNGLWCVKTSSYEDYFSVGSSTTFHTDNNDGSVDDWDLGSSPSGWCHAVFGVQHYGGGYFKFCYRNGVLTQKQIVGKSARGWTGNFRLGQLILEPSQYFSGKIDEMSVWGRALNSNDVSRLFNGGAGLVYLGAGITNTITTQLTSNSSNETAFVHAVCLADVRAGVSCVYQAKGVSASLNGFVDALTMLEYRTSATNWYCHSQTNYTLRSVESGAGLALASAKFIAPNTQLMFLGEPDGRVYSWSASSPTGTLQRQLFSAVYAGNTWNKMAPIKVMNYQGEGVVGVYNAPNTPSACNVVLWTPRSALPVSTPVPPAPPTTRLLPDVQQGAGVSRVMARIWGGSNYRALPELQFSLNSSNGWTTATVLKIDGMQYAYTLFVDALPGGSTHSLLWQSSSDLPSNYVGTVYLRARSRDMVNQGDWSESVSYHVAVTPDSNNDGIPDSWVLQYGLDPLATNGSSHALGSADGTGVGNLYKYLADLDPTNPASQLMLTDIRLLPQGMRLNWKGGTWATQFLEVSPALGATGAQWTAIYTNTPPTATTTNIIDAGATNGSLFYRIRATR